MASGSTASRKIGPRLKRRFRQGKTFALRVWDIALYEVSRYKTNVVRRHASPPTADSRINESGSKRTKC